MTNGRRGSFLYEDVSRLLRDKRLGRVMEAENFKAHYSAYPDFEAIQLGTLLQIEPPDHTRLKQVMQDVFTPRRVKMLGDRVALLCDKLISQLLAKPEGRADIIREFAEPIPVTVIADLLGVPEADRHQLVPWSKAIIGMYEPERSEAMVEAACQAALEFSGYISDLMKLKRQQPQDDLISILTQIHDQDPKQISKSELVNNCILLLNAGHEAVVNVIGNGLYALLSHPEELAKLKNSPDLIPSTIEEMMRFDTPLQFFERYVLEDIDYKGLSFKQGDKFCLYYASANHDEAVFSQPERFDISRHPNPHLAFGLGLHYCIGAPLARLELNHALKALLKLPKLEIVGEVRYLPKNVFRYLEQFEVTYR
ncbi:MAG: cytochrome P450 [Deinococcales bacterium]